MIKTQSEIIKHWKNPKHIIVSICTLAYNHERFIQDCIESILKQETDFAFELLIHDDASTDNTPNIIKEYTSKYPLIIKPIYQRENQHSQGINPSVFYNYPRANGDYIAWCEGDDYWIDKNKLTLQIEMMQNNPQCELSFHSALQVDYSQDKIDDEIIGVYGNQNAIIPLEDIMHKHYGMIPTASCIVNQKVKKELLSFQKERPYLSIGDLYMQFFGAKNAGALYIHKTMSVYRIRTKESWSHNIKEYADKRIQHELAMIRSYRELNQLTNNMYEEEFKFLIAHRIYLLGLTHSKNSIETYNHMYSNFYKILNEKIDELNSLDQKYVIYGAGTGAEYILNILDINKVLFIIDNDKKKKIFQNKPVFHISEIPKLENEKVIISLFGRSRSVIKDLTSIYGINKSNIITFDYFLIDAID